MPKEPINLSELMAQKGLKASTSNEIKSSIQSQLGIEPPKVEAGETLTIEKLREVAREDTIYPVPVEFIDFEDRVFYNRQDEAAVLNEEAMQELIQGIKEMGQKVPVLVRFNEAGKLQIMDGWRRSLAVRAIGGVPVKAQIANVDKKTAALLAAMVNFSRVDIPAYHKAEYVKRLCSEFEYHKEDVAKLMGVKPRQIFRILSIFKYPEVEAILKDGIRNITDCSMIAENASTLGEEGFRKVIAEARKGEGSMTGIIEKAKAQAAGGPTDKKTKSKSQKAFTREKGGKLVFKTTVNPKTAKAEAVDGLIAEARKFIEELMKIKKDIKARK